MGLRVTDSSGVKINPTWNRLKVEGGAEKMKSLQRLWSQAIEGEEREARTSVARGDRYLTEQDYYCYCYYQNKQKSKYPFVLVGKNWWSEVI